MVDETYVGKDIAKVWTGGTGLGQKWFITNGTDIIPGLALAVDGETDQSWDVDPAVNTDLNILGTGLHAKLEDQSLDVALGDGEEILVQVTGFANIMWMTYQANGASIKWNTPLIIGSEAGKLAPFAYVDGATLTDTLRGVKFWAYQDVTTDASNDQKILVRS